MHENYKMSAPGRVGIIACAKQVVVSELRGIARVAYLGEITNIRRDRTRKLLKEHYREGRDICVHDWARKEVALSESYEIVRVAYLCQIMNIGSGRARKL